MQCQTVRQGVECFFWKKTGCSYKDSTCHEIAEQCAGCNHVTKLDDKEFCKKYPEPALKWLLGPCNLATHVKVEEKEAEVKKINPLKAAKRMSRGR